MAQDKTQKSQAELQSLMAELTVTGTHAAFPRRRGVAAVHLGADICTGQFDADQSWTATQALISQSAIDPSRESRITIFQQLGEIVCTGVLPDDQNTAIVRHLIQQQRLTHDKDVLTELDEQLVGILDAGIATPIFRHAEADTETKSPANGLHL